MSFQVLFLCTGNSARSILCEATLNHLDGERFTSFSAGSHPAGTMNPYALAELERRGISTSGLRSKSWDEFSDDRAPVFDLLVTVCDNAASESCPVLFGDFVKAHWGLPDPATAEGDAIFVRGVFERIEDVIVARLTALVALPVEELDRDALQREVEAIGEHFPGHVMPAA